MVTQFIQILPNFPIWKNLIDWVNTLILKKSIGYFYASYNETDSSVITVADCCLFVEVASMGQKVGLTSKKRVEFTEPTGIYKEMIFVSST